MGSSGRLRSGVVIVALLTCGLPASAATWATVYRSGSARALTAYATATLPGGDVLVAGVRSRVPQNAAFLMRVDAAGMLQWQRTYGGENSANFAFAMTVTASGEILVAGQRQEGSSISAWLMKVDGTGQPLWESAYDRGGWRALFHAIVATPDGGAIAAGYNLNPAALPVPRPQFWVVKLAAQGAIEWEVLLSGRMPNENEWAYDVIATSDGGYLALGAATRLGAGDDLWLIKLSATGAIQWQKTYGGSEIERPVSDPWSTSGRQLLELPGGDFVVAAMTSARRFDVYDTWVLRLDPLGGIVWQKVFYLSQFPNAYSAVCGIRPLSDGTLLVVGGLGGVGPTATMLRLEPTAGALLWQRSYEDGLAGSVFDLEETTNGLIGIGHHRSTDSWVFKVDVQGEFDAGCNLVAPLSLSEFAFTPMVTDTTIVPTTPGSVMTVVSSFLPTELIVEDPVCPVACQFTPQEIAGLLAVRSGDHVDLQWIPDALPGVSYNVWYVTTPAEIDQARLGRPAARGVNGCSAPTPAGAPSCRDANAVSRDPTVPFFYQVRSTCGVGSEGP